MIEKNEKDLANRRGVVSDVRVVGDRGPAGKAGVVSDVSVVGDERPRVSDAPVAPHVAPASVTAAPSPSPSPARLIDGKALAANLRGEIAAGVAALKAEKGVTPGLAVILVGENPASISYVTAKEKACAEAGMYSREIRKPATITEDELLAEIARLNADPAIHGILVQLPLPKGFDEKKVVDAIAPEKDVDGFTPVNVGKMLIGETCFLPCTPHGIIKLIEFSGMNLKGKHAVVIGRSNIVGKPVAVLLARKEIGRAHV